MGRRYAVPHAAAAGSDVTIAQVQANTTTRGRIYDLLIGSISTPADVATRLDLIRGTVAGTGSGITPRAINPGDPAALLTAQGGTFTGQTKTANSAMLMLAVNQRATFRWVASPDGEIVIPATSGNWVGLESISSGGTPTVNATIHYEE